MKAFINNFNHFTWTQALVENLRRLGAEPVIVDNASTYEPLLEWYISSPCEIVRLESNIGHLAPWESGTVDRMSDGYYIVTDSDLDIYDVPDDAIQHLIEGYIKYGVIKSGLSIKIDDLPDTDMSRAAKVWEAHFWAMPTGDGFFRADIDTTFAVYCKGKAHRPTHPTIRADSPYTAKHLPWYMTAENVTEEFKYFLSTADKKYSSSMDHLITTVYGGNK